MIAKLLALGAAAALGFPLLAPAASPSDSTAPPPALDAALVGMSGLWVPPRCIGDGRSGPRVQVVYVHPDTTAGRLAELRPWLVTATSAVSGVFEHSSGGTRTVRWVHGRGCTPTIIDLSAPADRLQDWEEVHASLVRTGRVPVRDRVYLVYVDARAGGDWGGIGGDGFAMTWPAGWGDADAHELVHALGAVADGAPHSTGAGHCTDGRDLMCYDDGGPHAHQVVRCTGAQAEYLLDCGNDDYFAVHPRPGSWLARHPEANVARSRFLARVRPRPWPAAAVAPADLTATRSDGTLTVSWSVPAGTPVDVFGWSSTGGLVGLAVGSTAQAITVSGHADVGTVLARSRSAAGFSAEVDVAVTAG